MEIKDSGERTKFDTGAVRDCQEGKGRMDLLPFRALMKVSKIYEAGSRKYGANNWRKGIPLSRYLDSGLRHLSKWSMGMRDEPHLGQAVWNLLCLMETQGLIEEGLLPTTLNDIPYNAIEVSNNPNNISELKA